MIKRIGVALLCLMLLMTGCSSVDIVLDNQLNSSESEQTGQDLERELSALSKIKFKGRYDKDSTSVICEIKAPDLYSYMTEHMDSLMELSEDDLYSNILEYAKSKDCPERKVEIELPAHFEDEKLIVDTNSFAYQDAVCGGINSALSEIYVQIIQEAIGE